MSIINRLLTRIGFEHSFKGESDVWTSRFDDDERNRHEEIVIENNPRSSESRVSVTWNTEFGYNQTREFEGWTLFESIAEARHHFLEYDEDFGQVKEFTDDLFGRIDELVTVE